MPSLLGTSIQLLNHAVSGTDSTVLATSVMLPSCTCRRRAELLRALTSKKENLEGEEVGEEFHQS